MKILKYPVCEKCGQKIIFTNPRGATGKQIEEDWDNLCKFILNNHKCKEVGNK